MSKIRLNMFKRSNYYYFQIPVPKETIKAEDRVKSIVRPFLAKGKPFDCYPPDEASPPEVHAIVPSGVSSIKLQARLFLEGLPYSKFEYSG